MELAEKADCTVPEPRKEGRLTSIIEQLLNNKSKTIPPQTDELKREAANTNLHKYGERAGAGDLVYSPKGWDGLLTGSPEGGVSFSVQGQQPSSTPAETGGTHRHQLPTWSTRVMPTDALATSSTVEPSNPTAAASGGPAKSNDSPEPESSSPSISPHSPSPARGFPSLLVPGFGLGHRSTSGSSSAPFSPPPSFERFSPAGGAPAIKQMEMMTRNYSDFMRSLAAKYNNQNSNQDSFPLTPANGLIRGFDSNFQYKTASPFLVRNIDIDGNGGNSCLSAGLNRKIDSRNSPTQLESRNVNNTNSPMISAGIAPCGMADFSSSQTLLNLVRTASAQSASQLENYLKGAVKRTADGENRLDPLDLTVTHAKRPKLDTSGRELRDFRDLLQAEAEAATGTGGDCPSNLRTSSTINSKPAWMSLLDRRLHHSPTASSRTSPKNAVNLERQQPCMSLCTEKSCTAQSDASDVVHWTVDDVVKFVTSVESCSEYAEKFRDQSIDGSTLPLLTEEHLTLYMGLKLGPALKLRSTLARKIGHCAVCMHCIHCHGEDSAESRRQDSPSISK